MTQHQIIKEKLSKDREITNVWAVKNYILRLGARIKELRDEGMNIQGEFVRNSKGRATKVYRYYI